MRAAVNSRGLNNAIGCEWRRVSLWSDPASSALLCYLPGHCRVSELPCEATNHGFSRAVPRNESGRVQPAMQRCQALARVDYVTVCAWDSVPLAFYMC